MSISTQDERTPSSYRGTGFEPEDRRRQDENQGAGAQSLGAAFGEAAQTAADAVRRQASQFAADVGSELGKTGDRHKERGVDSLRRFARVIDGAADELEGQSPAVAGAVHEAARRVDDLSDSLASRSVNDLFDAAAQFARAQPALFALGSAVAGFALARFLKSSEKNGRGASFVQAGGVSAPQAGSPQQGG